MHAELSQFLVDITRGCSRSDFLANEEALIDSTVLPAELKQALKQRDVGLLWKSGAHPMALLYYSRLIDWPMERYYATIDHCGSNDSL